MIGNRICAIALAAASATICSTPSASASPFDGNWSVVAQTTQGHCGSIHFGLAINRGRLYSASGYYVSGYPAQLGGRVSPSGQILPCHRHNANNCDLAARCSKPTCANGLFDHLIGGDEEASRYSQTEGICRFEIEDGFVFRGGLYWKVIWLGTA